MSFRIRQRLGLSQADALVVAGNVRNLPLFLDLRLFKLETGQRPSADAARCIAVGGFKERRRDGHGGSAAGAA